VHFQGILWLFLPLFVAGGSALVAYYLMQARMEVALAKEREALAEARAAIDSHKSTMEERIRATEETARRTALDELMRDIRVEERSYLRDTNGPEGARRAMVMQERVFFRNLPMSGWAEREMVIESGPAHSLSARPDNAVEHFEALPEGMPRGPLPVTAFPVAPHPVAEQRRAARSGGGPVPVPDIPAATRRELRPRSIPVAFGVQ
jgi:hypothetical protein